MDILKEVVEVTYTEIVSVCLLCVTLGIIVAMVIVIIEVVAVVVISQAFLLSKCCATILFPKHYVTSMSVSP